MFYVENLTYPDSRKETLQEINDWSRRVGDFYDMLHSWIEDKPNYEMRINRNLKVTMFEEYMFRFKIKPIELPAAAIFSNSNLVASIKPIGLWSVQANGMIEINNGLKSYRIIDISPKFSKPNWKVIIRKGFDEHLQSFSKSGFLDILDDGKFF